MLTHLTKCGPSGQKHSIEVHIHRGEPILQRDFINRARRCENPRIVEQDVDPSSFFDEPGECRIDSGNICHVRRQNMRIGMACRNLFQLVCSTGQQPDLPSLVQELFCHRTANA